MEIFVWKVFCFFSSRVIELRVRVKQNAKVRVFRVYSLLWVTPVSMKTSVDMKNNVVFQKRSQPIMCFERTPRRITLRRRRSSPRRNIYASR